MAGASRVFSGWRSGGETDKHAESLVRPLEFKHRLRVCNAFPYPALLDVYRGIREKLTESGPMAYKECRDFEPQLKEGDKIEFKLGDATAGTFAVSSLPSDDAVLLLVIRRHDTLTTAVAFESHVFASGVQSPQVAVIDTYQGAEHSTPRLADAAVANGQVHAREEALRYGNAVAVNPGIYEVKLAGSDGKMKANASLVALGHESYVVLRTGVEAAGRGSSYPQELVVFPQSAASALRSGAAAAHSGLVAVLLAPWLALVAAAAGCGC
uniref:Uncharacterized protein n=1 Tax=Pyrodinium bahamense TaxID=73915 RepID=A0A7S0FQY7_9DINO